MKNGQFWRSVAKNNAAYLTYYDRLTELSISMFEWKNLPDTIDPRYLELALFADGKAIFFFDDVIGFLGLRVMIGGQLDAYGIPTRRSPYSVGYQGEEMDETNSVIIFNNLLHTNSMLVVDHYATRLWELDRIIDVNTKAQKTPILISCDEQQRLTLKNLYMKYDGNEPVIYGNKNINPNSLQVMQTGAPYISDKIYALKTQIWNEFLTSQGISNVNISKRERLITDEVTRNQGGTIASRYSRLESRRQACKQINEMFGLDIWCDYREDYQSITEDASDTVEGDPNSDGEGGNNPTEVGE